MKSADKRPRLLLFLGSHFGVLFLEKMKRCADSWHYRVVTYGGESDAYYGYENVTAYCRKNRIDCLDTSGSSSGVLSFGRSFSPDLILCGYYAKILPPEILRLARRGAYNIHPGLLPDYRGSFPTAWAILRNERHLGLTIHEMDAGLDTGPILLQKTTVIRPDETGFELYTRSMELGARLLFSFLPNLWNQKFTRIDQFAAGKERSYGRIDSHCRLNWTDRADHIRNLVRVHAKPYCPAYALLKNKLVFVNGCRVARRGGRSEPGRVLRSAKRAFWVGCGDGVLEVTDYELCPRDAHDRKQALLRKGSKLF